jgi:hypothetical protein
VAVSKKTSSDAKARAKSKAKSKAKGKRTWKMLGSGAALLSGLAMTRALDVTWKTATGRKPPTKPENPEITGREAMLWAALSGMAIGVAKTFGTRRAAYYWLKSTGELPPGMKKDASRAETKRAKKAASVST